MAKDPLVGTVIAVQKELVKFKRSQKRTAGKKGKPPAKTGTP